MATRGWYSLHGTTWRIWFISCLVTLRNMKKQFLAHRMELIPVGLPFAVGLLLFFAVSMFWRAFQLAAVGATLVLILQGIADRSPLLWTVPWEALEFILSRKVRDNHFWLHRTQELLRESAGRRTKADGFATREGFVLIGASLTETQIQGASQSAWRTMCQKSATKEAAIGCKTMQFLLALWLITGGLTLLSVWRRVDFASVLLLSALCGAAGHLLARPVEQLLAPWADYVACSNNKTWPSRLEVESFAIPRFLWFKKGLVFQVRRIAGNETTSGAEA